MRIPIDRVHGGNRAPGVVDFSISVNPFGPPAEALQTICESAHEVAFYPSPYSEALVGAIARRNGLDPSEILVGNGSTQLIYLLARVLAPEVAFVAIPTFSEIANALWCARCAVEGLILARERNFELAETDVEFALKRGAQAIFIGRPNSPTGSLLKLAAARRIAALCERYRAWCVFDEAFIDFVHEKQSCVTLCREFPRVIVLRSLTKIFTLPGLRVGYCVGARDVIGRMREALEPWSVNVLAELVALKCLEIEGAFVAQTRNLIHRERQFLQRSLGQIGGIRVYSSCANFLMFEVDCEDRRGNFGRYMLEHGVAVRDLRTLPGCGPGMYRIGVRLRQDNERFLAVVQSYFHSHPVSLSVSQTGPVSRSELRGDL